MTHIFSQRIVLLLSAVAVLLGLFFIADSALAVNASNYAPNPNIATSAGLPTQDQKPSEIVLNGIRVFMQLLGLVALVLIIYAGFTMLTSAGNSEKISSAKNTLIWTVIGVVVILSSLGILEFIDNTLYS